MVELLTMFLLNFFPRLNLVEEAFIDACLLFIIVAPFLYYMYFKPFYRNIQRSIRAEVERNKIREINDLKSEFISIAAHELRTPLTAIMGYSEILSGENQFDEGKRQEFTTIIHQKALAMERLIDDLTDMTLLESGQPILIHKEKNDIVATISSVLEEYRKKYPRRRFELNLPEAPVFLLFDRLRIDQVMGNLLSNAVKYSPEVRPVEIEGVRQESEFMVRVRDHGVGMSAEERHQVFDKYYRANTSDTSVPGLGLGMTIVRKIVLGHGGKVWLDSSPGAGTTVSFTLPIASPG